MPYSPTYNPFGLSVPSGGDDLRAGDDAMRDLADKISAAFEIADTLPASPRDGQLVMYQDAAMAAVGHVWPLRFRSGSPQPTKWEPVGAAPVMLENPGSFTIPSTTFGSYDGNTYTATLPGVYLLEFGAQTNLPINSAAYIVPSINGTTFTAHQVFHTNPNAAPAGNSFVSRKVLATVAVGDVLELYYKYALNPGDLLNRWLSILPVRVSAA